jgi:predicted nucleic acid-binding protein
MIIKERIRVLFDTNVPLDNILKREPFYKTAVKLLTMCENGYFDGYVSASAVTDMYYIACRQLKDKEAALEGIKTLLSIVSVAAVSDGEIRRALDLSWDDFEDAVQYAAGERVGVDSIVTRNGGDFADSAVPALSPEAFLALITGEPERD